MRPLCYTAVLCLVSVPVAAAPAPRPKATNRTRIVGTWVLVRIGTEKQAGVTAEFTRDGKVKVRDVGGPAGIHLDTEGKYTVDGDKITIITKVPGGKGDQKETGTITKLTDTELHLKDAKGETAEFRRKKGK